MTRGEALCFIDTETTGLHRGRQIWEIAMIRREPDGTEYPWESFVVVDMRDADLFGLQVGRFWDRHPVGKQISHSFDTAKGIDEIEQLINGRGDEFNICNDHGLATMVTRWTHDATIVGMCPHFDMDMLDPLLREHGFVPNWHHHLVDAETLAVGYLQRLYGPSAPVASQLLPPWDSDDINGLLGIDPVPADQRHTAMGDTIWAKNVYDRVMGTSGRAVEPIPCQLEEPHEPHQLGSTLARCPGVDHG